MRRTIVIATFAAIIVFFTPLLIEGFDEDITSIQADINGDTQKEKITFNRKNSEIIIISQNKTIYDKVFLRGRSEGNPVDGSPPIIVEDFDHDGLSELIIHAHHAAGRQLFPDTRVIKWDKRKGKFLEIFVSTRTSGYYTFKFGKSEIEEKRILHTLSSHPKPIVLYPNIYRWNGQRYDWWKRSVFEPGEKFIAFECWKNFDLENTGDNRSIVNALKQYAKDHGGKYPQMLSALVPQYFSKLPVCPETLTDTYSLSYESDSRSFVVCCKGHNHEKAGLKPNNPGYDSVKGAFGMPEDWPPEP